MITVLVAEDNDHVAAAIRRCLEFKNFAVLDAQNGEIAVNTTIEKRPDIILMDIRMPGIDGLEAIKRIRAIPEVKDVPIIAASGGLNTADEFACCINAGANRCLTKPYRIKDLIEQISELCDVTD